MAGFVGNIQQRGHDYLIEDAVAPKPEDLAPGDAHLLRLGVGAVELDVRMDLAKVGHHHECQLKPKKKKEEEEAGGREGGGEGGREGGRRRKRK